MKTLALVKRRRTDTATGKPIDEYRQILMRGFNHAAQGAIQTGHKRVCVMLGGHIRPLTVTKLTETYAVLEDAEGNPYGMVFENA